MSRVLLDTSAYSAFMGCLAINYQLLLLFQLELQKQGAL
jgi:hypothetical protein